MRVHSGPCPSDIQGRAGERSRMIAPLSGPCYSTPEKRPTAPSTVSKCTCISLAGAYASLGTASTLTDFGAQGATIKILSQNRQVDVKAGRFALYLLRMRKISLEAVASATDRWREVCDMRALPGCCSTSPTMSLDHPSRGRGRYESREPADSGYLRAADLLRRHGHLNRAAHHRRPRGGPARRARRPGDRPPGRRPVGADHRLGSPVFDAPSSTRSRSSSEAAGLVVMPSASRQVGTT